LGGTNSGSTRGTGGQSPISVSTAPRHVVSPLAQEKACFVAADDLVIPSIQGHRSDPGVEQIIMQAHAISSAKSRSAALFFHIGMVALTMVWAITMSAMHLTSGARLLSARVGIR
jgi:hypothetical protein